MSASTALRIVTFNTLLPAFQMVQQWAAQAGHPIVLTVTTPGPQSRRSAGYKQIVVGALARLAQGRQLLSALPRQPSRRCCRSCSASPSR